MSTITLAGHEFPVKISEGVRFIKDRGHWLKSTTFVNRLADEHRWEELRDLTTIGRGVLGGTLTFGSAQQTANVLKGARTN